MSAKHKAFMQRLLACGDAALLTALREYPERERGRLWQDLHCDPPRGSPLTRASDTYLTDAQMRTIVALGCDLGIIDAVTGHTALSRVVAFNNQDRVRLLLDAGADPNGLFRDTLQGDLIPVLCAAALGHNPSCAMLLIEAGARTDNDVVRDRLIAGAVQQRYPIAPWVPLLRRFHGVDDRVYETLMDAAIKLHDADAVHALLAHGVQDPLHRHRDGATRLGRALSHYTQNPSSRTVRIVQALLAAGDDPNAPDGGHHLLEFVLGTPSLSFDRHRVLQALLDAGADLDAPTSTGKPLAECPLRGADPQTQAVWAAALARRRLGGLATIPLKAAP